MEEHEYYFGISSRNTNETTFVLVKETDNETFTDFDIKDIKGVGIENDDLEVVLSRAVDMFDGIVKVDTFDSVRGEVFLIHKLSESEYESFI